MDDPSVYDGRMSDRGAKRDHTLAEVVLDWNGTVVADRSRAIEATNLVLAAHGLAPITDAEFGRLFSLPLRRSSTASTYPPQDSPTPRRGGTAAPSSARPNCLAAPWNSWWRVGGEECPWAS